MLAVEQVSNPRCGHFMVFISHGAKVSALKLATMLHSPRVCPTPYVNGPLCFGRRQAHAVNLTEHFKRADAT